MEGEPVIESLTPAQAKIFKEALSLEEVGNLQEARRLFVRIYRGAKDSSDHLRLRYLIARTSVASGTPTVRAARKHLVEARKLLAEGVEAEIPAEKLSLPLTEPLIRIMDGHMLFQLRREEEAFRGLETVLAALPKKPTTEVDRFALAQVHHNLGLCAVKLQDHDAALQHLRESTWIYASLGFDHAVARVSDGVGQLLSGLGRFREARVYLETSIVVKKRMKDERGQSISYGALSRTALRSGDVRSALRYAEKVLALSKRLDDKRGLTTGQILYADCQRRFGQRELEKASLFPGSVTGTTRKAVRSLLAARDGYLTALARNPDVVYQINATVGLAIVHFCLGDEKEALAAKNRCKSLYKRQEGRYPEVEEEMRDIETLIGAGEHQETFHLRLSGHVREAVEGQRKTVELESAKHFQEDLLPRGGRRIAGARVDVLFDPCTETSGDLYDFFDKSGGGFAAVGDVMGHGAGAAMLMVPTLIALRERRDADLSSRIGRVNEVITRHSPKSSFVTLCALEWDEEPNLVRMVSAGHQPPYILRRDGSLEHPKVESDLVLGILTSTIYNVHEFPVFPGDRLLLLTDGIVETQSQSGEMFVTILEKEIRRMASKKNPETFLQGLFAAVNRFRGKRLVDDDRTLLLISF